MIAINDELHCFLMQDAGKNLREYLKIDFKPHLLSEAIVQYSSIQRSTKDYYEPFFSLGVPDWRLDKLPFLYEQIINQKEFLIADGMTDEELQILQDLRPQFSRQCELLSQFQIPEALTIYDFNTNNVLIDPKTRKMRFIDWGEAVVTHPFFSLCTYLYQATLHHSVKESDQIYHQLQESCIESWV